MRLKAQRTIQHRGTPSKPRRLPPSFCAYRCRKSRPFSDWFRASRLHPWFRLTRGSTLGVRAAVIDAEGRVLLLVRHSYAPGWIFPGGGVERGETVYDAVRREMHEEAGIVIEGEPLLHGVFANHQQFMGDHSPVS